MTTRGVLIYMLVGGCLLQAGRSLYRLALEAVSVQALGRATHETLQDVVSAASNRPPAQVRVEDHAVIYEPDGRISDAAVIF